MATLVGITDDFKNELKDLIELEFDAIEAYRATIERLENPSYKNTIMGFLEDHNAHLRDLKQIAHECGIEAPKGPDLKQILTKGKVVIASLIGDQTVLAAMKTNEDDTVKAYERMTKHPALPDEYRTIMQRGLADEQRHRQWMASESTNQRKAA